MGRALARPPCLVSFSGGRDSSAVLALAVAVARREGFPLPIPATYRFAAAPGSGEGEWQEMVVRHLEVADWERIPLTSELDTVGPVAQAALRRLGVLWPFNAHFHLPVLERAAGGSLLTGIGGDELLGPQLWSSARTLLHGRRGHGVRLPSVALALSPRMVRRLALIRRRSMRFPWLWPASEQLVNTQRADWQARTPISWAAAIGWWWRSRYRRILEASMEALASSAGARIVHPFLDPLVVGGIVAQLGGRGPGDRSAAMRLLFADLLPEVVLTRGSKAHFDEAFVSDHSRSFAAAWTGDGVDGSLVDVGQLAAEWRTERPDPRSLLLMQAAWHAQC